MPGGRRGGGPPDLKGTLGSLIRTTWQQMGIVRDAVERGTRNQRVWLDGALLQRRHKEVLMELGRQVYELAATGELGELEEFPELLERLAELEMLEDRLVEATERARQATDRAREVAGRFAERAGFPSAQMLRRARDRTHQPAPRPDDGEYRVWRPVRPTDDELDDPFDDPADEPAPPPRPRSARGRRRAARDAHPGGGISFVDDELDAGAEEQELAEYMHAEDVPASEPVPAPQPDPDPAGPRAEPPDETEPAPSGKK